MTHRLAGDDHEYSRSLSLDEGYDVPNTEDANDATSELLDDGRRSTFYNSAMVNSGSALGSRAPALGLSRTGPMDRNIEVMAKVADGTTECKRDYKGRRRVGALPIPYA
jgi:hypothetical protein